MFRKLWTDDAGVVSLEYLMLSTIVGLGLVVGISNLENALNVELTELANAILALDQSYSYEAQSGCKGTKGGVTVTDTVQTATYGQSAAVTPTVGTSNVDVDACP